MKPSLVVRNGDQKVVGLNSKTPFLAVEVIFLEDDLDQVCYFLHAETALRAISVSGFRIFSSEKVKIMKDDSGRFWLLKEDSPSEEITLIETKPEEVDGVRDVLNEKFFNLVNGLTPLEFVLSRGVLEEILETKDGQ